LFEKNPNLENNEEKEHMVGVWERNIGVQEIEVEEDEQDLEKEELKRRLYRYLRERKQ
jgi:hypothetical protein